MGGIGMRQVKFIRNLPGWNLTVLNEMTMHDAGTDTKTGVTLVDADMGQKEIVAQMNSLYGSAKLATLDSYYIELTD